MSQQNTHLRSTGSTDETSALSHVLVLIVFLAISFAVAAFGTVSTLSNIDGWYATAEKRPGRHRTSSSARSGASFTR